MSETNNLDEAENVPNNLPLIVILGPTASGKTGYAIELAKLINGEIICADSRTVYKDMNIGTAKPTEEEKAGVPHFGLDLVVPNERFTLYDFQQYAYKKIVQIRERGHIPMLVGGSGLYIDSVIYHYDLTPEKVDLQKRRELESKSTAELQNILVGKHLPMPTNKFNKRHLVRTIERGGRSLQRQPLDNDTLVFGIQTDRNGLRERSKLRSQQMLDDGVIEETKQLLAKYGPCEPLKRNAYGVVQRYLNGEIKYEQIIDLMVIADGHLVKKQLTWWRKPWRNDDICWCSLDQLKTELVQLGSLNSSEIVDRLKIEYKNSCSGHCDN